jgi:hypothetical protein
MNPIFLRVPCRILLACQDDGFCPQLTQIRRGTRGDVGVKMELGDLSRE